MRRLAILLALAALAPGCSLQHVKLYDGPERPASEQITLSSVGLYPERRLALMVVEVDGKSIANGRAASYLLLPGSYQVKVQARKDFSTGGGPGLSVTFKQAEPVSRLEAKAGHTYVPNATISGDLIWVYFEDKGPSFPEECLPLYVAVKESPNPGNAVYRTDKKCER